MYDRSTNIQELLTAKFTVPVLYIIKMYKLICNTTKPTLYQVADASNLIFINISIIASHLRKPEPSASTL